MLIAEEYLLLTMNDKGVSHVSSRELGVAGALLSELAAAEKVMLDERDRLSVLESTPTGDEVLDEALLRIEAKAGKKPKDALAAIGKGMPALLLERLSAKEVVQEDRHEVLGVRIWSGWPLVDPAPRDDLRAELLRVLTGVQEPDARTGALISLLQATSAWGSALPKDVRPGVKANEIRASAKKISKGRWGSQAVKKAIDEITAAITVVVTTS